MIKFATCMYRRKITLLQNLIARAQGRHSTFFHTCNCKFAGFKPKFKPKNSVSKMMQKYFVKI